MSVEQILKDHMLLGQRLFRVIVIRTNFVGTTIFRTNVCKKTSSDNLIFNKGCHSEIDIYTDSYWDMNSFIQLGFSSDRVVTDKKSS